MPKRRIQQDANGGLDLFLDAISNTFGGVMFLAILLVILTQFQSKSVEQTPSETSVETDQDPNEVLKKIDELRMRQQTAVRAEQAITSTLSDSQSPDVSKLIVELQSIQQQIGQLHVDQLDLAQVTAEDIQNAQRMDVSLDNLDFDLQNMSTKFERTSNTLDEVVKTRAKSISPPTMQATKKDTVALLIRGQRVYAVWQPGTYKAYDSHVTIQQSPNGSQTVTPKPRGGWQTQSDAGKSALATYLADFKTTRHFLLFIVWPDSFETFVDLKAQVVESGFQFDLATVPSSMNEVTFGASTEAATAQ